MKGNRMFMWLGTLALGVAARAPAQEPVDPRWAPWLGCWQPVEDVVAGFGESAEAKQAYFCVRPAAGGVEIATVVDGAPVSNRMMRADGVRHAVSEDGCTGWQTAAWSADGQRLFVTSELRCEGGVSRTASGLMAMDSPTEWIDAHAVGIGDERVPRAVRYRPAPATVAEQAGFDLQAHRYGLIADARRLAAAPLSVDDVAEAAGRVDAVALEVFLFEREEAFELNAARIVQLADAGVPAGVIDLMVALSYPRQFSLDRSAMAGEFRPAAERPEGEAYGGYYGRDRYWDYCYGRGFYSYCSPYGYMPLGWSYGYYNPWFYGSYGGYGYGSGRPVIIVNGSGDGEASPGGRAVKGQGYTRTSRGSASSGGSSSGRSATSGSTSRTGTVSSGGSSTGSASGSTGSSGSSSSGRTAKKRGGG